MDTNKKSLEEIKQMLDSLEKRIDEIKIPKVESTKLDEILQASKEKGESEDHKETTQEEADVAHGKTQEISSLENMDAESYNAAKESNPVEEEPLSEATEDMDEDDLEDLEDLEENDHSPVTKKSHLLRNVIIILIFALIVGYGATSYYFTDHFFNHTIIWGQDCSYKTVDEVKELVKNSIGTYSIDLKERGGQTEKLTAKQLELDLLNDGSIERLLDSQSPFQWITGFWKEFDYHQNVNLNLDQKKLTEMVLALKAEQKENVVAPQNAYYDYSKEDKKYVIIPEVEGCTIDNEVLIPALQDAILSKKKEFDFEEAHCYVEPTVRKDAENLIQESNALNEYLATNIVYDFGDRKEVVGADLLRNWISLDDKKEVILDKNKVRDFVEAMADKYDTLGKKRKFKSIAGNSVKVSGGTYGWKIDQDKEYKKLLKLIKKHKQVTREPVYSHVAKSRNKNDLGKTYVEIDLSKQHLWYYKKGKTIVSTPVVTGDETKGRGTPTGVYYILYKQTNHVLRGPGYASPVDFWMPFIEDRGIGIHDSSWRGSYGGHIFYGNGSHGCVNTPRSAVSEIFHNIDANCPVVVHW